MFPMAHAPRDGRRILVKYQLYWEERITHRVLEEMGIDYSEYSQPEVTFRRKSSLMTLTDTKWEEAWWDKDYRATAFVGITTENIEGGWMPWCGKHQIKTSIITNPLGWTHLPEVWAGDTSYGRYPPVAKPKPLGEFPEEEGE